MLARCVEPELLDELPPEDPCAVRSRQDLVRLNAWMGHSRIMARGLDLTCHSGSDGSSAHTTGSPSPRPLPIGWGEGGRRPGEGNAMVGSAKPHQSPRPRRIVELGGGDGRFLLRVARRLSPTWNGTTAVLIDRHSVVSAETKQGFTAQGWTLEVIEGDVFDWLSRPTVGFCDAVVANLFLHHFSGAQLTRLLAEAGRLANAFVAIEPRRAVWPLTCSHMVWMIGCNRVTQNDAPTSVRAGFAGRELSRLWPADGRWSLEERRAGWCSHVFIARRSEPAE